MLGEHQDAVVAERADPCRRGCGGVDAACHAALVARRARRRAATRAAWPGAWKRCAAPAKPLR